MKSPTLEMAARAANAQIAPGTFGWQQARPPGSRPWYVVNIGCCCHNMGSCSVSAPFCAESFRVFPLVDRYFGGKIRNLTDGKQPSIP